MNIKLLRQVKKVILEEPKKFDMSTYGNVAKDGKMRRSCASPCCIAGTAVALARIRPYVDDERIFDAAMHALELDDDCAWTLFHDSDWKTEYYAAYRAALRNKDHLGMAKAAAKQIDFMIRQEMQRRKDEKENRPPK